MPKVKKHFFILVLCFIITSLSFHHLWAEDELKKSASDQQKGGNQQEQVYTEKQPKISLDSAQYDVGEIYEGDIAVHTFTVKNTGTAQLNISKVKAG